MQDSYHALSGATQYVQVPHPPRAVEAGETFQVIGAPVQASSWQLLGDIPLGLTVAADAVIESSGSPSYF